MKKTYSAPQLVTIGQIKALTGMFRNSDYLDNSNGSDAWKKVTSEEE
jgi:hypothetical protein